MSDKGVMRLDNDISPQAIMQEGTGKACQAVAQSVAITIQDAVDNLRNINTMVATAVGVATAQMLAGAIKISDYTSIVDETQKVSKNAIENLSSIGASATGILSKFPGGTASSDSKSATS